MADLFYQNGLRFSCTRCSSCCRGESGFVFLAESDIAGLAAGLRITRAEFEAQYCRTVRSVSGERISLKEKKEKKEKNGFDCIFWENGCKVYENRPAQCRTYPFWEKLLENEKAWRRESLYCPGINHGALHPFEEIQTVLKTEATNRKNPDNGCFQPPA
jgi:Fe-S-cluster containining protein